MLALYKGLPLELLGVRWYTVEEITGISEGMVNNIAAESILWRNISEIEARATLGKIYAEYKLFDRAAEEWEEIPLRNLLIRENLVVQLGKIYFGRDELLRAIKLWEQLPAGASGARLRPVGDHSERQSARGTSGRTPVSPGARACRRADRAANAPLAGGDHRARHRTGRRVALYAGSARPARLRTAESGRGGRIRGARRQPRSVPPHGRHPHHAPRRTA